MTRSGNSGRAAFVYALADQGAVSAGNFLVIALGAHFLPIAEQGKLVYAFGIYYGLVVFNIAAFFTVPLLLRGERAQWDCYRRLLLRGQLIAAAVTALGIGILLARWGGQLQWPMSRSEFLLLGGFYFLQQLADFYRRSGYVFDVVLPATVTSQLIFWSRIGALVIVRPATLEGVLAILAASAAIGALAALLRERVPPASPCSRAQDAHWRRAHLRMSAWSLVNAPLAWGGLHLPILLVGALAGGKAAAILGSIRGITAFLNVLLELLETLVPTWLASRLTRDGTLPLSPALRLLAFGGTIWLVGLVVLAALGERIMVLTLGRAYQPYAAMLLVIWVANGLYFIGRVIGLHYRMTRDLRAQTIGSAGGILALLASLPLVARHGEWGGAFALAIAQAGVILMLGAYWLLARTRREAHDTASPL